MPACASSPNLRSPVPRRPGRGDVPAGRPGRGRIPQEPLSRDRRRGHGRDDAARDRSRERPQVPRVRDHALVRAAGGRAARRRRSEPEDRHDGPRPRGPRPLVRGRRGRARGRRPDRHRRRICPRAERRRPDPLHASGRRFLWTRRQPSGGVPEEGGRAPQQPPTPRPATLVPAQPYTGTPSAGPKPFEAIVAARERGVSNAELLARVERERVVYSLSIYDIQKLRAAGVSGDVIEAMMRSGRVATPVHDGGPTGGVVTPR